jgi:hypothetical protein
MLKFVSVLEDELLKLRPLCYNIGAYGLIVPFQLLQVLWARIATFVYQVTHFKTHNILKNFIQLENIPRDLILL